MKRSPTYLIIQDNYTNKSIVIKSTNEEDLAKLLVEMAGAYKVDFRVVGAYGVGESETIQYSDLVNAI